MNSYEQLALRKIANSICNFKIKEIITDMVVKSTVNNK